MQKYKTKSSAQPGISSAAHIMKAFIIIASLVALSAAAPPPEALNAFIKCQKDSAVSEEVLTKVQHHEFDFDSDKEGQCFVKCIAQSVPTVDGELNIVTGTFETAHPDLSAEKLHSAASLCNALKGEDDCQTAYKRFQCFFKEVPEFPVPAETLKNVWIFTQ